jgi:hypothetical protein
MENATYLVVEGNRSRHHNSRIPTGIPNLADRAEIFLVSRGSRGWGDINYPSNHLRFDRDSQIAAFFHDPTGGSSTSTFGFGFLFASEL